MRNKMEKAVKASGQPAPRRLEYIPEDLRGIPGVEELTTVRQMKRLLEYCHEAQAVRPPFVRLGASVHSSMLLKRGRQSSATYAVDVNGAVSVLRRIGDPRRIHLWMSNERRAWNLAHGQRGRFISHLAQKRAVRIVTLASLNADTSPIWLGLAIPEALRPDGEIIRRVWACAPKRDAGGADREFIVEGREGWWEGRSIPDLVGIREAPRSVLCAEDATLWVGPLGLVEIPLCSFADTRLLEYRGAVIEHLGDFLVGQLRAWIAVSLRDLARGAGNSCSPQKLEEGVNQSLSILDPFTASHAEVKAAAEKAACAMITEAEVKA